jgi:mRNA interferase MazF
VVLAREYGKPRPAVVVQSDRFKGHPSIIVCPITTELRDAPYIRLTIEPTATNGLEQVSQLMVDKLSPIDRSRIGKVVGQAEPEIMERLGTAISAFLDLA